MPGKFFFLLAGATATGKSAVAQCIAEKTHLPILSADSMLVYRGMDIGTAKPSAAERGDVPYYGIDLVTPEENFSAGAWAEAARAAIESSDAPGFIVTGGTGLYFRALVSGFDFAKADPERRAYWQDRLQEEGLGALQEELRRRSPESAIRLGDDMLNPRRVVRALEIAECDKPASETVAPAAGCPVFVLRRERNRLHRRIALRIREMFDGGLLDETEALREKYPKWSDTAMGAIGYAEALAVLDGTLGKDAAMEKIGVRTNRLAKRQETWFRHQIDAQWIDASDGDTPESLAERIVENYFEPDDDGIRIKG